MSRERRSSMSSMELLTTLSSMSAAFAGKPTPTPSDLRTYGAKRLLPKRAATESPPSLLFKPECEQNTSNIEQGSVQEFLEAVKSSLSSDDYDTFLDNMVEVRSSFRKKDIATFSEKLNFVKALLTSEHPHLRLAFDMHFPMTDTSVARNILELRISDESRLQYNQWFEHSILQIERQRKLDEQQKQQTAAAAANSDATAQQTHQVAMMQWLALTEAKKQRQQQQQKSGACGAPTDHGQAAHTHGFSMYASPSAPILPPSGYIPNPSSDFPYTPGRAAEYVRLPQWEHQEQQELPVVHRSKRPRSSSSHVIPTTLSQSAASPETHYQVVSTQLDTVVAAAGEGRSLISSNHFANMQGRVDGDPDGVAKDVEAEVDGLSDLSSPAYSPSPISPAMVLKGSFSAISGLASGTHSTSMATSDAMGRYQAPSAPEPPQAVPVSALMPRALSNQGQGNLKQPNLPESDNSTSYSAKGEADKSTNVDFTVRATAITPAVGGVSFSAHAV